jgi:hypothetical protein
MNEVVFGYFLLLLYFNRFTESYFIKLIPLAVIVLIGFLYYFKNQYYKRETGITTKYPAVVSLLVLILSIGICRSKAPETTLPAIFNNLLTFLAFIFCTMQVFAYIMYRYDNNLKQLHKIIVLPFTLFAIINIVFWLMGFQNQDAQEFIGESVLLANFGLHIQRVKFPFANGINSYAAVIGACFTIELVYYFILKQRGLITVLSVVLFAFTLTLTDSRSALFYPILITLTLFFIQKMKKIRFIKLLPLVIVFGTFMLMALIPLILNSDILSSISRSSEDFASGNARFFYLGYCNN